MLGSQVVSDLELTSLHTCLNLQTPWGRDHFTHKLTQSVESSKQAIKAQQLPLLALYKEPEARSQIRDHLSKLPTIVVDEVSGGNNDQLASESIMQILWKRDSYGSFLNTNSTVINGLVTWKTIILPGLALLMPLLALIIPFFVLKFMNPSMESSDYLMRVRTVLLQQISVPTVLTKWKGGNDRIGFVLESLFIGLTLAMFISSLWNQVSTAFHYRRIWNDLLDRGRAIQTMITHTQSVLGVLRALPLRKQKALRSVIESGEHALDEVKDYLGKSYVACYGAIWNDPTKLDKLKSWIAHIDVLVSICSLENICFPSIVERGVHMTDVYHPQIKSCISNNYSSCAHTIITGPNRGGKSTYCKAIGLSIVTAQTWGFAWARRMTFAPFSHILTALEPAGKLGFYSTFEAEIEFAKTVLATSATSSTPIFVMMDEIFHSTNASDGLAASRVFLEQLYKKAGIVSIISTHYRELAESYAVSALQLLSTPLPDGRLDYTYKVSPGVSTASSVMEILIERGLVSAATAVASSK